MMRRPVAVLWVCLALGACSKQEPVPPDHFYRLPDPRPQVRYDQPPFAGLVLVRGFRADALHSERAIVFADDAKALTLQRYHYHFWLDGPPRLLQEYMVSFLRTANFAELVNSDPGLVPDFEVTGKIRRLERQVGEHASSALVDMELSISKPRARRPILIKDYTARVDVANDAVSSSVEAMEQGIRRIFSQFVQDAVARVK